MKAVSQEALTVPCTLCGSKVQEQCTVSTTQGRRSVSWPHVVRLQEARTGVSTS